MNYIILYGRNNVKKLFSCYYPRKKIRLLNHVAQRVRILPTEKEICSEVHILTSLLNHVAQRVRILPTEKTDLF